MPSWLRAPAVHKDHFTHGLAQADELFVASYDQRMRTRTSRRINTNIKTPMQQLDQVSG